ncbi:hypothetical protein HMI55_005182 [Coelomomyces lativittatus]|nr:hypothetical protein HMI55_005182 [Coelomomyces lativittatus]
MSLKNLPQSVSTTTNVAPSLTSNTSAPFTSSITSTSISLLPSTTTYEEKIPTLTHSSNPLLRPSAAIPIKSSKRSLPLFASMKLPSPLSSKKFTAVTGTTPLSHNVNSPTSFSTLSSNSPSSINSNSNSNSSSPIGSFSSDSFSNSSSVPLSVSYPPPSFCGYRGASASSFVPSSFSSTPSSLNVSSHLSSLSTSSTLSQLSRTRTQSLPAMIHDVSVTYTLSKETSSSSMLAPLIVFDEDVSSETPVSIKCKHKLPSLYDALGWTKHHLNESTS